MFNATATAADGALAGEVHHPAAPSLRLADVFRSIQGEGLYEGTPSGFIRTTGCNLRCWFCDTPYTSHHPEGAWWTLDALVKKMDKFGCEHVVITGGEPMLPREMATLSARLSAAGHLVTIETAGTLFRSVSAGLMSISPKLTNSQPVGVSNSSRQHARRRLNTTVLGQLMAAHKYQLKFVIDTPDDLSEVAELCDELRTQFGPVPQDRIWLMPQGVSADALAEKERWLLPLAERHGYRFCARRHIELFGNTRGT